METTLTTLCNQYKIQIENRCRLRQLYKYKERAKATARGHQKEIEKQTADSSVLRNAPKTGSNKNDGFTWQSALHNWGQSFLENLCKLLTLVLAIQMAAVQALCAKSTEKDFVPKGNSLDKSPLLPGLNSVNRTFLTDNFSLNNVYASADKPIPANITADSAPNHVYRELISEKFSRDILEQFDKIDAELQNLVVIFSTNKKDSSLSQNYSFLRQKCTAPSGNPNCAVPKESLEKLKNEMSATVENPAQFQNSDACSSDCNSKSENCEELIKVMKCMMCHLRKGFTDVMSSSSLGDITEYNNKVQSFNERFTKVSDDIERNLLGVYKEEIDNLKNEIQDIAKKLDKQTSQLKETTLKLCISEIGHGKFIGAVRYFKELKDDSKLIEIIQTAYTAYTRIDKVEYIINFVWILPEYYQKLNGFQNLFKEMRHDLDSPKVILLHYKINKVCLQLHVSWEYNDWLTLRDNVKKTVNNIISGWAYKLQNGDYKQILDFEHYDPDVFENYVGQLITEAYAHNLKNAKNILKFISDTYNYHGLVEGYKTLYNNMKNEGHLDSSEFIELAYGCKAFLDLYTWSDRFRDTIMNIEKDLPSSVIRLIWHGDSCTIKNVRWNEYLYIEDDTDEYGYDDHRRGVYTWKWTESEWPRHKWKITPKNNAESFTIRNNYKNEYLYADDDPFAYDDDRRTVYTWVGQDDWAKHGWKLTPVNSAMYFTLYNMHQREYLYSPNNDYGPDKNRRWVFTWKRDETWEGDEINKNKWMISC